MGLSGRGTLPSSKIYHQDGLVVDPTTSPMNLTASRFYEGLGNEMSTSTDSNYPQYMLNSAAAPNLSETSNVLSSQHSDYPRHWSPIQPTNKSSSSTYYSSLELDATTSVNMGSIMSGFIPSSAGPRNASGVSLDSYPTIFPALSSLSSSLPESGSRSTLSDKVLPPLGPARMPATDFGGFKLYSTYTDSSGPSSASHSRSSTSTHRSPAATYVPSSPSMQHVVPSSSERTTPTFLSSSTASASASSMSNYATSSASDMTNFGIYPSSQQPLLGSSVDHPSGVTASVFKSEGKKQQQQRTEADMVPHASAIIAPPLRTCPATPNSGNGGSSSYHQNGEQQQTRHCSLNKAC